MSSTCISDYERLRNECTASQEVIAQLKNRFSHLREITIIRHLILCKNDVERVIVNIEESRIWRQITFPLAACPYSQSGKECVLYTHGYDSFNHPLFIYTPRLNDIKTRNLEELIRWALYMLEVGISRMAPDVVQITLLVNRLGMTQGTDVDFARRIRYHLDHHYPARVYKIIFYPASLALKASWGVVKTVTARRMANALRIKRDLASLRRSIPDKYIPAELGGSCTYQFNMKDYPSPFAEEYDNVSKFDEVVSDELIGVGSDELTTAALDNLYFDDNSRDYADALGIMQPSVAARFVKRTRSPISPPVSTSAVTASRIETATKPDHVALREECTASPEVLLELKKRYPHLTEITIIRHLLLCDCDLEIASRSIEDCQLWRQTVFPMTCAPYSQTATESLLYCHGHDRNGRPLLIYTPRLNDPRNRNLEELKRWLLYMMECALKQLPRDRVQITVLVNRATKGTKIKTDFELLRWVNEMLIHNYPARVHKVLFHPASPALSAMWGLVTSMVHKRSTRHVHIVPTLAQLRELIPDKYIPAELGGSCIYQFNMKDYPSPFAEDYNGMLTGYGYGMLTDGNEGGQVNDDGDDLDDDFDMSKLYYNDEELDNGNGLAITQPSVGAHFSSSQAVRPMSMPVAPLPLQLRLSASSLVTSDSDNSYSVMSQFAKPLHCPEEEKEEEDEDAEEGR